MREIFGVMQVDCFFHFDLAAKHVTDLKSYHFTILMYK